MSLTSVVRVWLVALTVGAGILCVAHFVDLALLGEHPRRLFDLSQESNFGSWYSSALHFLNALLLCGIASSAPRDRWRWWLLAVLVLGASADEAVELHERTSAPVTSAFHVAGGLTYAWVIPAMAVVVPVAALCGTTVLRSPGGRLVLVGAGVFLAGAVGLELVEAAWLAHAGHEDVRYLALTGVEETMEMLGAITATAGLQRTLLANLAGPGPSTTR